MAIGQKQKVKRIGGILTVSTPGYFLRCAACGKKMKKDEKALIYLRNGEYTIDAIDHVHTKECDERYKDKYAVK